MKVEHIRAASLFAAVLGGFLVIYLGYDLYKTGVEGLTEATGAWDNRTFWISSGGPGLLFVLAGMAIVVAVVLKTQTVARRDGRPTAEGGPGASVADPVATDVATTGGGGGGGGGGVDRFGHEIHVKQQAVKDF